MISVNIKVHLGEMTTRLARKLTADSLFREVIDDVRSGLSLSIRGSMKMILPVRGYSHISSRKSYVPRSDEPEEMNYSQ
jgi:hypothetical protein